MCTIQKSIKAIYTDTLQSKQLANVMSPSNKAINVSFVESGEVLKSSCKFEFFDSYRASNLKGRRGEQSHDMHKLL